MMVAIFITGLNRVSGNHVQRKANTGAGCAGLTGLTGFAARVRVHFSFPVDCRVVMNKFLTYARNNHVNPVNPVEATASKAYSYTGLFVTLLNPVNTGVGMKKTSMRDDMPTVAAWVDAMREAFGKEEIDGQMRKGMRGEPVFFASEQGREVGTRIPAGREICFDRGMSYEKSASALPAPVQGKSEDRG